VSIPRGYALPGVDTNLVVVYSRFVKLSDAGGVGVDVHPPLAMKPIKVIPQPSAKAAASLVVADTLPKIRMPATVTLLTSSHMSLPEIKRIHSPTSTSCINALPMTFSTTLCLPMSSIKNYFRPSRRKSKPA